jgi:CBS domain-containing protein
MDRDPFAIPTTMTVSQLAQLVIDGASPLAHRQATPLIDASGKLAGIITRGDMLRALGMTDSAGLTVLEAGSRDVVVAYPDETVRAAVDRMLVRGVGRMPVVSRDDPRRLVGYLGRTGIMEARARQLQDENLREQSWGFGRAAPRA